MDLRPFYYSALENNARLFGETKPGQITGETPCDGWDVRALMNHMIGGMVLFAAAHAGESVSTEAEVPDFIGDDPTGAFESARKTAADAWNDDEALDRTLKVNGFDTKATTAMRIALVEAIVHGWDLAKATGQEHGINPMVATAMLDGLRKNIKDEQRGPGKFFGYEVKVPDDAPIEHQLVAFLGRTP